MTADPAERIQMLTVGGRVLRVATRDGQPGRPPLLLCNGIGGRLELFQPFVDALDPRRGVIRFDMPGIGESPAPVVPYHLATLAPKLTRLLDQLGVARADVLGISWGGGLAQQFALSRPDRVHRLVLVATGPGALMVPGHPKVLLNMLTPRRHRDPGHAARIAGQLYGGSLREDPALARELLHATARLAAARGYYYQLLSGIGWTSLPRLRKLRPPTLILAGDDDPIIPAHGSAGAAGLGRPRPAGTKGTLAFYTPQLRRISVMREDCRRSSPDDAQGQPRGTAALHQAGDLVPVDVAGINLGQRLGDAELGEPCHAPVVHEQLFVLGGLAAGDG